MIDKNVARRYGKALFDLANQKNQTKEIRQELELVVSTIEESPEFLVLINGRVITTDAKKKLMFNVFGNYVSKEVLNFIYVALDKGREAYFAVILEAYVMYLDQAAGIVPVKITAAVSLAEKQVNGLGQAFEEKLKNPVRLDVEVDQALIGGLKAQIGDTVYDGSILSQLATLQKQLCK